MTNKPPLDGIRVLDFTQNLPGPYATALLSSLGAEVIKVEPERGDGARMVGRFFELVNSGKKSIAVDLKDEADRAATRALALEVDVVVEGFRPGVMATFGLDAASLRSVRPSLVYCSISAYGQEGPYKDRPGHDINLQALVGACDLGRDEDEQPRGGALPVADLSASMTSALAIVAALYARRTSGEGATIDVALTDTVASWSYLWGEGLTPAHLPIADALPNVVKRIERIAPASVGAAITTRLKGSRVRRIAEAVGDGLRTSDYFRALERARLHALPHYGTFRCKDGKHLAIGIVEEDKFWRRLCESIGLGRLARIPVGGRVLLAARLRPLVRAAIARRTREEWLASLDLDTVPVSPVLHFAEALLDPQLAMRRIEGATPVIPPPLAARREGRSPRLGQHNALLGAGAGPRRT